MCSWIVEGDELMYCPKDYPEAAFKITGGGNPILFPSVGRTWDRSGPEPVPERYVIEGDDSVYRMPSHGIVFQSKWSRIEQEVTSEKVTALYELHVPDAVREECYPFDVSLRQQFVLRRDCVELKAEITNVGSVPAPVAFGYHPYFRISNPSREGVEVRLPITKEVILTKDTILPTGDVQPADGCIRLQPDVYYDASYEGITDRRMSLIDRNAGRIIHVEFDSNCEGVVLYSPDGSEFICIEPWTRGLGAYERLRNPGWETGEYIPVLQPGQQMHFRSRFSVERCAP